MSMPNKQHRHAGVTYGENILDVRLRAHLDVAQRHHADLLSTAS
ncbi:hypothetical protein [Nocardia gipuzkoensis]